MNPSTSSQSEPLSAELSMKQNSKEEIANAINAKYGIQIALHYSKADLIDIWAGRRALPRKRKQEHISEEANTSTSMAHSQGKEATEQKLILSQELLNSYWDHCFDVKYGYCRPFQTFKRIMKRDLNVDISYDSNGFLHGVGNLLAPIARDSRQAQLIQLELEKEKTGEDVGDEDGVNNDLPMTDTEVMAMGRVVEQLAQLQIKPLTEEEIAQLLVQTLPSDGPSAADDMTLDAKEQEKLEEHLRKPLHGDNSANDSMHTPLSVYDYIIYILFQRYDNPESSYSNLEHLLRRESDLLKKEGFPDNRIPRTYREFSRLMTVLIPKLKIYPVCENLCGPSDHTAELCSDCGKSLWKYSSQGKKIMKKPFNAYVTYPIRDWIDSQKRTDLLRQAMEYAKVAQSSTGKIADIFDGERVKDMSKRFCEVKSPTTASTRMSYYQSKEHLIPSSSELLEQLPTGQFPLDKNMTTSVKIPLFSLDRGDILLNVNQDGFKIFKTAKADSAWAFRATVYNYHPRIRNEPELIHTWGLITGHPKNLNPFYWILLRDLNDPFRDEYMIRFGTFTSDEPAEKALTGIVLHGSKFACPTCETFGMQISELQKAKNHQHYYFQRTLSDHYRTHNSYLGLVNRMQALWTSEIASENDKKIWTRTNGIKFVCLLVYLLPEADMINMFPTDVLHVILLGCVSKLTHLALGKPATTTERVKKKQNSLDNHLLQLKAVQKASLDAIINNLKVDSEAGTIHDPSKNWKHWSGAELLLWCLYAPVVLKLTGAADTLIELFTLIRSIVLRIQHREFTDQSINDLTTTINAYFDLWVDEAGQSAASYVVHRLLHIPYFIRKVGPPGIYQLFAFERLNKKDRKMVHIPKEEAMQIMRTLALNSKLVLQALNSKEDLYSTGLSDFRELITRFNSNLLDTPEFSQMQDNEYQLNSLELKALNNYFCFNSTRTTQLYAATVTKYNYCKMDGRIYSCYETVRRCNRYVSLTAEMPHRTEPSILYGEIQYFYELAVSPTTKLRLVMLKILGNTENDTWSGNYSDLVTVPLAKIAGKITLLKDTSTIAFNYHIVDMRVLSPLE